MSDTLPTTYLCPVTILSQKHVYVTSSEEQNHGVSQWKETLEVFSGLVSLFPAGPSGISGILAQSWGPDPSPTLG